MFTKFKNGSFVIDIKTKKSGKVIGQEGAYVLVEVILEQNKEEGTRTTQLIKVPHVNLRPYNPKQNNKVYKPYFDVMEFHKAFGHPVATKPTPIVPERAKQRADYLVEELVEFLWASVSGDEQQTESLVNDLIHSVHKAKNKCFAKGSFPSNEILLHQTDALNDINYINYGSIVETGVNPKPVFDIIHQANMKKLDKNGKPIIDATTNKIMKPDGWEEKYKPEPLIKKEIESQLNKAKRGQ
ncbi:NTP pyrophosphohydrolase [Staphylococcus pseudintermedius]|uniref:NTP pyrophosphohydrolase n=2 Tax=Staphylococcus pseudintermedius TaxID=283734 RepID=UPI0019320E1D|nr:NTP pyrophosphohydrolase [Staphylococcus pseudintermedius]EGQ0303652.1 NTP pyrophosphohydrolase [Staphylococcus pseudintermedius]EGQ2843452.1 NTP pyrophosphohydrolase [Staphylococcus pseudintermedius]EGQ3615165.1 NTP pyrophosphohydrolase [Staphylococcus pseudintermedius]EGQ3725931.1 NTP pyrophosphohydrolase [Staphylococcus pseudintermedius]EHT8056318.1 NTP pyrophosphohydrolase [Staphylococcus pseudintermedius]